MMVGAAPFGVIFGTLVSTGPLTWWHGELMSLAVYAGSAQFIALGLVAGGAGFAVVLATTFIVNLRHLLYSATLAPHVAHLPLRWRATLGALLTDEAFAVAHAHYRQAAPGTLGPHYFFGSSLAIVVPQLAAPRQLAAALTAGVLACCWQGWPYKLGLLAAVAAGVAVGVALSRRGSGAPEPTETAS